MKVTVKTLKGEKFPIEVEASATVAQVKTTIEAAKSEMVSSTLKLIHSGKVLKDGDTLEAIGVKENDFLVVMVTKPKKAAAAPVPPVSAAAEPPKTPAPPAAASVDATTTPAPAAAAGEGATVATPAASSAAPDPPAAPSRAPEFPDEIVENLVALGFPETEVRHCLRAAQGNPNVAVEFLTNGIPPSVSAAAESAASPSSSGGGGAPLQALRNHPQFNDLRRLVQSNPAMLQQVLTQIGQQQPELLREINANQAAFLALMNEPIQSEGASSSASSFSSRPSASSSSSMPALPRGADPAQMAQMMQNMDPSQLQVMSNMMGLTPEQVQAVGRMIGQLPPEQLQEYMAQALDGGGGGGGGPQVLRLTEEEMAAVDRLAEMGFDRSEAAQAFLACDKNEALAANLLMDGGFGGSMDLDGDGGNDNDDNDDDMYS